MKINEVDPRNYDSDIDYYDAVNRAGRKAYRDPDSYEKPEPYDAEDDIAQQRQRAAAKFRQKRETQWDTKQEGTAPNGQKYNSRYIINAVDKFTADMEAHSFTDYHWGAKKLVDQEYGKDGDRVVLTLYIVDNHKHGMWKPWADQPAQESAEQDMAEGWFTDLFKKKQAPAKPTISAEEFEQKAKSWKKAMLTAYKKIPELIQLNQWAQVKATASKVKNGLQKGINEGYITFDSLEKAEGAKKRVNSALNVKIFDEIKVNIKPEDFAGGGTGALLGLAVGGIAGAAIGGALGSSRRANKQTAQQLAIANAQSAAQHKTTSNRQDNKEAVIQRITKFEPTFIKIISLPAKTIPNNPLTRDDSGRIEPTLEQGVAEGFKNTYSVGDRVDSPLGTGVIVAVSPHISVDGRVKVKLDDPSRAGEDGKYKDTFVLDTTQLKHIADEKANPYAIGMAQAMKSTGDKPPLKKSTINKAHEIARAIKKGE